MNLASPRIHALRRRWHACSPRERAMLGLMAAAILAFLYAYAVALPLSRWADAAQARHATAISEHAQVQAIVARIGEMAPATPPASPRALADTATSLGLDVESAGMQAGQVYITLAPAAPERVFAWIEQQRLAGQPPVGARLESRDGGVAAELRF